MTNRRDKRRSSPGRDAALRTLGELVASANTPLVRADVQGRDGDNLLVAVRLSTKDIEVVSGGLHISSEHEDVVLAIPAGFPWVLPTVTVEHTRFVGAAHVLQGYRLCVYLDPSQEWHPSLGIAGFLTGLWQWFADAAGGKFDPSRALFHPVGGVIHRTPGAPTIVVREALGLDGSTFAMRWLRPRTPSRLDLTASPGEGHLESLIVGVPAPLRYGAGMTVGQLAQAIAGLGFPRVDDFLGALAVRAARNAPGSPLYFVLAVPAPRQRGPEDLHLIAGRLPVSVADRLRTVVQEQGPIPSISTADVQANTPIEWCALSEERGAVTTRRDIRRPINAFLGADICLWGCGGLGSWIGEFLARAGASRIMLSDPGDVTGGLLVRQNFQELDIGRRKGEALALRLSALRDDLDVEVVPAGMAAALATGSLPDCDLLIDATVNSSVAAAIGSVWHASAHTPLVATVATDRATATLGLLSLTRPTAGPTPEELDRRVGEIVLADPTREGFHTLWARQGSSDEILPAPGCSVPTFHGSAADVAGVAASLVSLLGPHLRLDIAGCHLIALPHGAGASSRRCHEWIEIP